MMTKRRTRTTTSTTTTAPAGFGELVERLLRSVRAKRKRGPGYGPRKAFAADDPRRDFYVPRALAPHDVSNAIEGVDRAQQLVVGGAAADDSG